jgi:cytochrome c oxidase assembly protein subunit 11
MSGRRGTRTTALLACGAIAAMLGLTAASVPLYRLFCQVTGYGGTTQRAEQAPGARDAII